MPRPGLSTSRSIYKSLYELKIAPTCRQASASPRVQTLGAHKVASRPTQAKIIEFYKEAVPNQLFPIAYMSGLVIGINTIG